MASAEGGPTQEEVDRFHWWHSFTFGNGVKTRGVKDADLLDVESGLAFKHFAAGKTLVDVGANNGFFSVEAARRGAARILALERGGWNGVGFQQFDLVRRHLGPAIEAVYCDVMHLRLVALGMFDVVLFLGVLYHLRHPLYVLEMLAEMTREQLVVETHIDADDRPGPSMVFYPGDELAGDPSNWWGPNVPCVRDMLRTVGFRRVDYSPHPRAPDRGFFHAFK